jgi:hypothetical protein
MEEKTSACERVKEWLWTEKDEVGRGIMDSSSFSFNSSGDASIRRTWFIILLLHVAFEVLPHERCKISSRRSALPSHYLQVNPAGTAQPMYLDAESTYHSSHYIFIPFTSPPPTLCPLLSFFSGPTKTHKRSFSTLSPPFLHSLNL